MSMLAEMSAKRPMTAGHVMWAEGTATEREALKVRNDGSSWADVGLTCRSGHPDTSR